MAGCQTKPVLWVKGSGWENWPNGNFSLLNAKLQRACVQMSESSKRSAISVSRQSGRTEDSPTLSAKHTLKPDGGLGNACQVTSEWEKKKDCLVWWKQDWACHVWRKPGTDHRPPNTTILTVFPVAGGEAECRNVLNENPIWSTRRRFSFETADMPSPPWTSVSGPATAVAWIQSHLIPNVADQRLHLPPFSIWINGLNSYYCNIWLFPFENESLKNNFTL